MHPYSALDAKAYWSTAVARKGMEASRDLWTPKFDITRETRVATFGSCFAQHFGRQLSERNFNWAPFEHTPPLLSAESRKKFNYEIFSVRTGNIYTATMLLQWVRWALDHAPVPDEVWQTGERYIDPFRPGIEPDGFASVAELVASRQVAIAAFAIAMRQADVLVFTLGLTESWFNVDHGYEYPVCPGTVAGEFDDAQHRFVNQEYPAIRAALGEAIEKIRSVNPALRVLLTVSPVPLTATMSGRHVLIATTESKSTLRAVAGSFAREHALVDYFPSYEIITAPVFRGAFFEVNERSVRPEGVARVMDCFFGSIGAGPHADATASNAGPATHILAEQPATNDDVICEEALLEAFAPKGQR